MVIEDYVPPDSDPRRPPRGRARVGAAARRPRCAAADAGADDRRAGPAPGVVGERRATRRRCPTRSPAWWRRRRSRSAGRATSKRPSSCVVHRGTDGAPVFQFNHWVTPAEPVTAHRVNTSILRERLVECTRGRGTADPRWSPSTSPSRATCSAWSSASTADARYRPSVSLIDPMPPVADAALPWDREVADPVATLAAARADVRRHLRGRRVPTTRRSSCSRPRACAASTRCPKPTASKGVADWMMLRRKLPDELFDGRRTMPHELFGRDDVAQLPRASSTPPSTSRSPSSATKAPSTCSRSPAASATAWASRRGPARHRDAQHAASTSWSPRSTSSTDRPRSCTRKPWPRSRHRASRPSSRRWRGSKRWSTTTVPRPRLARSRRRAPTTCSRA